MYELLKKFQVQKLTYLTNCGILFDLHIIKTSNIKEFLENMN